MPLQIVKSLGVLDEERVIQMETTIGHRLPEAYREFLLSHNGGYAKGDNAFRYKLDSGPYTDSRINEFISVTDQFGSLDEMYMRLSEEGRIPGHLFPFARDPFGNLICISLVGDDRGAVYFWDHENEPDDDDTEFQNVHLIADSFRSFIDGLVPPDTFA